MKETHRSYILLKFKSKIWKSLVTSTCPKLLWCQKTQSSLLEVNFLSPNDLLFALSEVEIGQIWLLIAIGD